jgi:hypothetical protein
MIDDAEATRRHLEGLIGGRTRWREHIEQGAKVLGISWDKLPLKVRQEWWKATDYGRHPLAPEFMAQLPELLATEQAKLETAKQEIAADTARAREFLTESWRRQPPLWGGRVDHLGRSCAECLRPAPFCQERCLRSMCVRA